jgi:hypothetical protein
VNDSIISYGYRVDISTGISPGILSKVNFSASKHKVTMSNYSNPTALFEGTMYVGTVLMSMLYGRSS